MQKCVAMMEAAQAATHDINVKATFRNDNLSPEGPNTQHLRTLVPKTIPLHNGFWNQSP